MNTTLRTALLLGATLLLATGCTGGPTSTSAPPGTDTVSGAAPQDAVNPAIPQQYRARAKAFARYRAIDSCGMHDLDAAKQASGGDGGDEIMPSKDGLNQCALLLSKGEFHGTWTLRVEVGAGPDPGQRESATQETVAGQGFFIEKGTDDSSCAVYRPLDDETVKEFAIGLRVRFSGPKQDNPKPACAFARDYITAAASLWADPPTRDSGRTTPQLALASLDPCDAAAALLEDYEPGTVLFPFEPYRCVLQGPNGSTPKKKGEQSRKGDKTAKDPEAGNSGDGEITIGYEMDEDPMLLVTNKATAAEHTRITVGNHTAVTRKSKLDCTTRIIFDPDTTVVANARAEGAPVSYQVISLHTETCEQAQPVAEKVMAKVGRR